MVYLLVVLVVVFVTPYETDYPATVLSVGCLMLLVGGARLTAGKRLSASPVETLFRWKGGFRLLVFSQFLLWGLFCALTVGLYGTDWTAMLVLFCSSALAGGGISSLAPDYKLGARCLLAIMLPTSIVAAAQGTTETYTITFLTGLYLAFLLLQARQHEDSYWATSVAAALEATRESDKLFRAAFENAGIGMALIGTAGQFLRVNGALCEMFARSEKELLAADLPSLSHADDSYTSRGLGQTGEPRQQLKADLRMEFHDPSLVRCQRAFLLKQIMRNRHLADVMQQRCQFEIEELLSQEAKLLPEQHCKRSHPFTVRSGLGTLKAECRKDLLDMFST